MTSQSRAGSAYFQRDGDAFVPTSSARGPWGESVSGNFVGGLLGHLVDADRGDDTDMHPARLTVDLLRPVAMAPVRGRTRLVRRGRRLHLVDAELLQDDTVVARASALLLRRGPQPDDDAWTTPIAMPPIPPDPADVDGRTMLLWVFGAGAEHRGPSTDLNGWQHDGPKAVWVRDITPLVDGVELTPFTRAAIAGDYASSLTSFGSTGLPFINADYSISLSRLPDGPHIGLSALTHHSHDGIATGVAAMFDRLGPIGNATTTALANPGFAPPAR
ncbi:thioesterase family protein [Mycobacterium sp. CPCC 205372]|uniref:Thioesterase family protein n=1 Tax=Mycobacterium hippophais TaxID=3016340 RepID=A0ABT4Q156_9MYCO|nr:acyl-CoA thioesterase domain-containing protein [Mycobacterium hippophais]MCZ8382515.1 thioesterase family protein [Mycobacterium hippophais]